MRACVFVKLKHSRNPVEARAHMGPCRCLRKLKACPPQHKLLQISLFCHTVACRPRTYSSLIVEHIGSLDMLSSCSRLSHNTRCHYQMSSHKIQLSTFQQNWTTTHHTFFIRVSATRSRKRLQAELTMLYLFLVPALSRSMVIGEGWPYRKIPSYFPSTCLRVPLFRAVYMSPA